MSVWDDMARDAGYAGDEAKQVAMMIEGAERERVEYEALARERPLVIIPNYVTQGTDVLLLEACLKSLRQFTEDRVEVMVVDDCSPDEELVKACRDLAHQYDGLFVENDENVGFSKTVNVGLRHALETGVDAVLCNADIEFVDSKWLDAMLNTENLDVPGEPAAVVGALLKFPNGLVQHAGVYFSLITRIFDHSFKYAPGNLREVLRPKICPVTAALQLIRHDTLVEIGVYDERFKMSFEDMDYCIRVFQAGKVCVYQPRARAIHHESIFRSRPSEKLQRWHFESYMHLVNKYADQSFAGLVPFQ